MEIQKCLRNYRRRTVKPNVLKNMAKINLRIFTICLSGAMRENRLFSFEENLDGNGERFSAYKAYTYTPGWKERPGRLKESESDGWKKTCYLNIRAWGKNLVNLFFMRSVGRSKRDVNCERVEPSPIHPLVYPTNRELFMRGLSYKLHQILKIRSWTKLFAEASNSRIRIS